MSSKGLPETAMISAYMPFSIDPTRSCQPIISAFTEVAVRKACAGCHSVINHVFEFLGLLFPWAAPELPVFGQKKILTPALSAL